jgi:hypothetical protein
MLDKEWISLVQDLDQRWDVVNALMKCGVP